MDKLNIVVVGSGVIGRTHVDTLLRSESMRLAALVDPSPASMELAAALRVPHYPDVGALLNGKRLDGCIIASPNHTHVDIALSLLRAGVPVLLEKPLADQIGGARELLEAVRTSRVPLLLGHHRRHNPIIQVAKRAIDEGMLGDPVTAVVNAALLKPDAYFDTQWRKTPGQGGPVAINLSHEVDLLRHFFGEVESVQAVVSHRRRGFEVEDTCGSVMKFACGMIATLSVSDAASGPWAWDLTAGENPQRFPAHDTIAHQYSGSVGGLSLPDLRFWSYPSSPDWTAKMLSRQLPYVPTDVYAAQLVHFGELIRGQCDPMVSCEDGVRNMEVLEAIHLSSQQARTVQMKEVV
ncbi:Gfo/Idh/MocA family protein [Sedimenticola sp.]|uniref:Gfo/Idh/MocA family protein n=1 Tax=Sedimenticola sp. TaxID=1940285 RepID=UPI003D13CDFF